jgi:hypothetical protein
VCVFQMGALLTVYTILPLRCLFIETIVSSGYRWDLKMAPMKLESEVLMFQSTLRICSLMKIVS